MDAQEDQAREARFDAMFAEEDKEHHIVPFRPLAYFIKFHVHYLPVDTSTSRRECPICREDTSESHERMMEIDLPNCHHIFGADCFERYIQRSHTCPMCREMWFEERLTREVPSRERRVMIEIVVANQQLADATADALERDDGGIIGNLMGAGVAEVDDEEDTETQDSANEEEANSSNERSTITPSVNSELEATRIEVTFGAGTETESDTDTNNETESEVSSDGGRTIVHSEDHLASHDVDRAGHSRRSGSDDDAAAPPRQRRRYD
ncbi:uncharacterized protein N0V89_001969 [Didymosphaeria variabile]|uniref:RING-type domain-containing protein n=1 Tax=Didymosphaeria variabile TaxID=1932322 RepID=A0A9W8XRU2_9PLEO|nr:uncharacterized protein N0V89_001969 [Didymosphaeria variabile]KAJ4357394.1 hypothetical protein N0V89_001969 [Didymosphaeria variabile]